MKGLFVVIISITALIATYGFAQMGSGMKGGEKHEDMMEGQHQHGDMSQNMMEHKGMMSHEDMMGNMTEVMDQMSIIMGDMSEMMENLPKENTPKVTRMMKDVCAEMNRMTGMMDSGMATEKDMDAMHERVNELQKRMSDMMK